MLMELFLPAVHRTSDEDSVIYLEVARHLEFFDLQKAPLAPC